MILPLQLKSVVTQLKNKELHLDLRGKNMTDLLYEYLHAVSRLFKFIDCQA